MIRSATTEDAESIARVHIASWKSTYQNIVPASYLDQLSLSERTKMWNNILEKRQQGTFVAIEKQQIIAFADCGSNRNKDLNFEGELFALYLLEGHQGKGLGKKLFFTCTDHLKESGIKSMCTWVLKDNPSRGFYEKMGGVFIKKITDKIGGKELIEYAYGWKSLPS